MVFLKNSLKEGSTMARIKIEDLPENMEISDKEIKRVFGGSAASWYSLQQTSGMMQQWTTPSAKIIGPGGYTPITAAPPTPLITIYF